MTKEYIRIMNRKIDKSILFTDGAFVCNLREKNLSTTHFIANYYYHLFIIFIIITMPNTNLSHDATAAGSTHIT